jgi:cytochrome c
MQRYLPLCCNVKAFALGPAGWQDRTRRKRTRNEPETDPETDEDYHMKFTLIATAALLTLSAPAFAGDPAKGEKEFNKCKSCHEVVAADGEVIVRGGKTGPNLYGIIGRTAGTYEDFKYGDSIVEAGAAGLVWDAENFVTYVADPKKFLAEATADSKARSKMSFKLAKGVDDIAAYLISVSPASDAPATN